jgi:tetratricopeptide (TPR) repeat protein
MTTLSEALAALEAEADTSEDNLEAEVQGVVAAALAAGLALDPSLLRRSLESLRRRRRFRAIELVAEGLEEAGLENGHLIKLHAQALIERGAYLPAAGLIDEARSVAQRQGDAETEADCWGLEGRIFKDLYVQNSVRPEPRPPRPTRERLLRRSVAAYHWVFARAPNSPDSFYHGVNAMAVTARGLADGFSLPNATPPSEIANTIHAHVEGRFRAAEAATPRRRLGAWEYANAAEACAALGRWDEAILWINRYLREARDDAFALNGTLRQFTEVWGVREDDPVRGPIVVALRGALIAAQNGGATLTQDQVANFDTRIKETAVRFKAASTTGEFALENERVLGAEGPVSMKRLLDIMDRARAVGRVKIYSETQGEATIGTGFLLPGKYIDPKHQAKTYFVTNAHVVSNEPERDGARHRPSSEVFAAFDRAPEIGKLLLKDLVWCSSQHEHDMSVFEVNVKGSTVPDIIEVAPGLPNLKRTLSRPAAGGGEETYTVPGKVYVIGYPLGQELSISLFDNDLIDHENVYGVSPGSEPRRIHYRAPTEKGNSGSPVFNSLTLQLIGVHHRGGRIPKLKGQLGEYKVNEGMWIRPAINEMRATLGFSGDMFESVG